MCKLNVEVVGKSFCLIFDVPIIFFIIKKKEVISVAPKNAHKRKLLEAMIIRLHNPSLNEQLETKSLILFRNGVT